MNARVRDIRRPHLVQKCANEKEEGVKIET